MMDEERAREREREREERKNGTCLDKNKRKYIYAEREIMSSMLFFFLLVFEKKYIIPIKMTRKRNLFPKGIFPTYNRYSFIYGRMCWIFNENLT